jgi:hypothetical protein
MTKKLQLVFLWLLALSICACVLFPDDAPKDPPKHNGGSDTETLTGAISTSAGTPAARILVKLLPANYNPSLPDTALIRKTYTDDRGHFKFEKLDSNAYFNVIAGVPTDHFWAYAESLRVSSQKHALALSLAKVVLVSLEYSGYQTRDSGVAYFPGTDILTRCNGFTASRVDSVPTGVRHIVVSSRAGWTHDTTLVSLLDTTKIKADFKGITVLP